MALLVQKFGGTSVGSIERIQAVVDKVAATRAAGHEVVVVVSAMSGETDRLINLTRQLQAEPDPREYSMVVATGEQVSIGLLALALQSRGIPARSYTGVQVPIITDSVYDKARIVDIHPEKMRRDLQSGYVVVVAGFQGVDPAGHITTLGRGGSDTTAVAIAAALHADECQIYTDVEGVYTTDPRVVPQARLLERITFEEMLELASLGAKVLQIRAVEFAGKYNVPLRVLSSFVEGPGTLITYEEQAMMEKVVISGIAFNRNEAKLTLLGIPDSPGVAARILTPISDANIEVDMIIQNPGLEGLTNFTFTVHRDNYTQARTIIEKLAREIEAKDVVGDNRVAKLSLVGVGMRSHAGVASQMFRILSQEGINIQLISTSEIKVSVVVDEKYIELGVRALHTGFGLDREPMEEVNSNK